MVEEQRCPDGSFPTVRVPNPEDRDAFRLAFKLAEKNGADVILATDPDSDRLGVAAKNNAEKTFRTTKKPQKGIYEQFVVINEYCLFAQNQ